MVAAVVTPAYVFPAELLRIPREASAVVEASAGTGKTYLLEHLVADRIIRFANLVGKHNVIAGTDCGFAQSQGIQRVHPSVMWAKFQSLVEGARLASEELFS